MYIVYKLLFYLYITSLFEAYEKACLKLPIRPRPIVLIYRLFSWEIHSDRQMIASCSNLSQ